MTTASRELVQKAPRTGPWIIAYAATIGAAFAASATGIVQGPETAAFFWIPILGTVAMIIYTSWKRHSILGTLSDAVRKFWRRIVVSSGFMFLSYCLLAFAQMATQWSERTVLVIALLPALGFAGMIWTVHQYAADETDEYLRAQAVRQLLIASFFALMAAVVWSVLGQANIVGSGQIGLIVLFWFVGLGIGRLVNEMRP